MPPLWNQRTPLAEDGLPIEVARLEHGAGFVGPVVKDHRSAHAVAAVAVDGGHVGAIDAVMLETLVERLHAHGPHAFGNQIADRVVHHGAGDTGLEPETVGEVGGAVEFAAAHVDLALGGLAKGNDARGRGGAPGRPDDNRSRAPAHEY